MSRYGIIYTELLRPRFLYGMHVLFSNRAIAIAALTGILVIWPATVSSQAVTGAGSDATPLPAKSVRFRLGGVWDSYDRVYVDGTSSPVLSKLSTAALGVNAFPQLRGAEQAMRSLSGSPTFQLSLGTLEALGDVRSTTTPFAADVGITDRLTIGLVVPYVESRDNALLILNRAGTSATVGRNPAFATATGASARSVNGALLRQLASARTRLSAELLRCAAPAATNCDAIRANTSGANALLVQAAEMQLSLKTVYGDSVRGGSPVVPINGSALQTAILARLTALRTSLVGFGVNDLLDGVAPASATVVNGPGSLKSIANDSAYGLDYTTLGGTRRAGIGDVDLSASYLWYNSLGERPATWLNASQFGVRSQATLGWRFGSSGADRTDDAFDVPIGTGANAMLVRSTTDVVVNRLFWFSGTVRIVQPFSDNVAIRHPLFADSALFVPSVTSHAKRALGRTLEIELAPRLSIGRFIGLSGGYMARRSGADQYTFGAADSVSASTIATGARTYHAYMIGATFSTMASYIRGRARWPVEMLYVHTAPLGGSGTIVPAVVTDRLELRIYAGYPRR